MPTIPFSKHSMKEMNTKLASSSVDLSEKKPLQNIPRINQFQSRKVFQREMSETERFKRIKVMAENISRVRCHYKDSTCTCTKYMYISIASVFCTCTVHVHVHTCKL